MKNLRRLSVLISTPILLGFIFSLPMQLNAQIKYRSEELVVNVKGSSTAGDWQMKSNKGQLEGVFGLNNNKLTALYTLWFTVECESLKSGTTAMEKNAYKALKSGANETINFVLKSSKIKELLPGTYEIKCTGFLTISGVEKETEMTVNCVVNADNSLTCTGSKNLKLSDFDIKLNPGLLNNIQPGDDIAIAYNVKVGKTQ